ncbi:hypothetical protein BGZ58_006433, partial [Dissophora ornata]
ATTAVPIGSQQEIDPVERGYDATSFQAFADPLPSSFLVEFNLPAAGVSRHERIKLEQQGAFQSMAASRHERVANQHEDFLSFLSNGLDVDYSLRHEFFTLMNGMSIDLQGVSPSELPHILEQIRSMPGVVKVSPLITLNQPKTVLHDTGFNTMAAMPQLSTVHERTGVLDARDKLNYTGEGMKVGIIDTGVDYTHEALGSCYGPGCKVQCGYDFIDPENTKTPGGFDCVGVKTFTTLGSYRVFPCTGSSKDDIIIAALERAYEDGMDVVNLSLGGGSSWANTPLAGVAGKLVEMGVVVVAAIGNDGDQGVEEVSSPSVHPKVISVASFEGSGYLANYFEINTVRIDYAGEQKESLEEIPLDLVFPEHDPEGCKSYPGSIKGSVAFVKRGNCTFISKAQLAQEAGAIGCIFYNNVEGGLRPKMDDPTVHIFGHGISQQQGQLILDQFKTSNGTSLKMVFKALKAVFKNEMANQVSTFSSWGLGPELEMKPDIGAPGGYIYSTVPVAKGSFAVMSGTSMATPCIVGLAVLLLQAEPKIDRSEVLGRLQMYSRPGLYKDTQIPDSVVRQGAGMANVFDAIRGKAVVQPTRLGLNDTLHTQKTYTLTLTNHYSTAETFKFSHWPAMSILGYTPTGKPAENIAYNETAAKLVFDHGDTLALKSGETRTMTFQFKPPTDLNVDSHWIYSGYVKIEPTLNTSCPALQVPYAGMYGSYGTVDILDLESGFPLLLGSTAEGRLVPIVSRSDQALRTFTMVGRGVATLVLKISNPVHNLQFYVVDALKKIIIGLVPADGDYVGRTDSVRSKFFVVRWAGRVIDSKGEVSRLPNGDYSLAVVAPKPFSESDSHGGGDNEVWMSPMIRIQH